MTENEAIIKHIEENNNRIENIKFFMSSNHDANIDNCKRNIDILAISNKALEKQIPKKPIEKVMPYSEEVGFNSEWHCPCCESYIGYFTEGMSEPEQMEYCNNCGQHIAKDWSDTD